MNAVLCRHVSYTISLLDCNARLFLFSSFLFYSQVRSTALAQFEDILHHFGRRFPTPVWRRLLAGVVFPLLVNAIDSDPTPQPVSTYPAAYTTSLSAALGAQSRPPSNSENNSRISGGSGSSGSNGSASARSSRSGNGSGSSSPTRRPQQRHHRQSVDSWIATSLRPALAAVVRLFAEHLEWQSTAGPQSGSSLTSTPQPLLAEGEVTSGDRLPEVALEDDDEQAGKAPGLHTLLPLLVGFLESITTNSHSKEGCPQGAELLARIGISTLAELLETLSGCPLPRDAYLGNGPSEEVWDPLAGALMRLAIFASSTSFEQDAPEGAKSSSNSKTSPFSERLVGVDVEETGGLSDDDDDDDGESTSSSLSDDKEEEEEEEGDKEDEENSSQVDSLKSETFEKDDDEEDDDDEDEDVDSSAAAVDDVDVDVDGEGKPSSPSSSPSFSSPKAPSSSSSTVAPAQPNAARKTKARVRAATRRAASQDEGNEDEQGGSNRRGQKGGKRGFEKRGGEGSFKERASHMLASLPSPRSPKSSRAPLAFPSNQKSVGATAATKKSSAAAAAGSSSDSASGASGARVSGVKPAAAAADSSSSRRADTLPMVDVSGAMTKMVLALKVIQVVSDRKWVRVFLFIRFNYLHSPISRHNCYYYFLSDIQAPFVCFPPFFSVSCCASF